MRIVLTLALITAFSLACGYAKGENPKEDAFVEKVCANVNDQNWRSVNMGSKPSRQYCEEQMSFWYGTLTPPQPCNIGGMAKFCLENEAGLNVYGPSQSLTFLVHPTDMERVRQHLDML